MVKLPEDDPALVHEMLMFLYSCNYDEEAQVSAQHPFEFNARLYGLADKYGFEDLKDFAKYSLSRWLDPLGRTPFAISDLVKALRVIYTNTLSSDRGLRDLVIPAFKRYRIILREDPDFVEMLSSGWGDGEFAMDVFDALLELSQPKKYRCDRCDLTTIPKVVNEEVKCWQCKKPVTLIVERNHQP